MFKKLDLQYFSEQTENTESTEKADAAAEPENTETKPPKEETKDDKTIPYDRFKQVNEKAKQYESVFEELGLDGVDSLKSLVSDYQERKKADEEKKREEMSEIERLQADLKAKEEAEQTLSQQLQDFQAQVQQEKINNEFIKKAQAANIAYVDDAIRLADLSAVKVEDGKVEGVDEVIKSLIENKPFLLAQKKEARDVGNPSNFDDSDKSVSSEKLLADAAEKAKKSGKMEDLAAYQALKRELS